MRKELKVWFDNGTADFVFSLAKKWIFYDEDENIIRESQITRQAIAPTDIKRVKEFIGDENNPIIEALGKIWTKDVVKAYEAKLELAEIEAEVQAKAEAEVQAQAENTEPAEGEENAEVVKNE